MARPIVRLVLASALALSPLGCSLPLGPWGGPAYTLDTDKIGTGEPAITPRNDGFYAGGEALSYRSHR
jgi:hypothetical protein